MGYFEEFSAALESNARLAVLAALLAREDIDVDLEKDGTTLIHLAVGAGRSDVVEVLLSMGANPNVADISDDTPLLIAVRRGEIDSVKSLVNNGAFADGSADKSPVKTAELIKTKYSNILGILHSKTRKRSKIRMWAQRLVCGKGRKK